MKFGWKKEYAEHEPFSFIKEYMTTDIDDTDVLPYLSDLNALNLSIIDQSNAIADLSGNYFIKNNKQLVQNGMIYDTQQIQINDKIMLIISGITLTTLFVGAIMLAANK